MEPFWKQSDVFPVIACVIESNMVSWFSQRITIGESDWAEGFEGTKIDGLWAYKPIARSVNP